MTGPEHYRMAETYIEEADEAATRGNNEKAMTLALCALAHSNLANVAMAFDTASQVDRAAEWNAVISTR